MNNSYSVLKTQAFTYRMNNREIWEGGAPEGYAGQASLQPSLLCSTRQHRTAGQGGTNGDLASIALSSSLGSWGVMVTYSQESLGV